VNDHTDRHLTRLRREIRDLGPWHLDVEVVPGLRTGDVEPTPEAAAHAVEFVRAEDAFVRMMRRVHPDGLQGRSFLDVACNCGAYAVWARNLGAGRCLGFDAREHWIRQARFLAEQRVDDVPFEFHVGDVTRLETYGWGSFDIVHLGGILYHLPFPMETLRAVAGTTKELLYVNSASRPSDAAGWVMARESTEAMLSGIHGLHWFPTGPNVVVRILEQLGFVEFRVTFNETAAERNRTRPHGRPTYRNGRFGLLAAKQPGLLSWGHPPGHRRPALRN
jgi:hypothetical protein